MEILNHLFDGILFGIGFALINVPIELYIRKPKRRVRKVPVLKLIKNIK